MELKWTEPALRELVAIQRFISGRNPAAAALVAAEILATAERLKAFPEMGRPRPNGSREMVVPGRRYILQYDVKPGRVEIVHVWHGAQNR